MDVLTDKQLRSYDNLSRYLSIPLYYHKLDDKYIYGVTSHLNVSTAYENYKIVAGDTLDSLALKFYGNPTYYWIIADFNRLYNGFVKLLPGQFIKIPVKSSIEFNEA